VYNTNFNGNTSHYRRVTEILLRNRLTTSR